MYTMYTITKSKREKKTIIKIRTKKSFTKIRKKNSLPQATAQKKNEKQNLNPNAEFMNSRYYKPRKRKKIENLEIIQKPRKIHLNDAVHRGFSNSLRFKKKNTISRFSD